MGEGGRLGGGSGRLYIVCFSDKQQSTSESWMPTTTSGEAGGTGLGNVNWRRGGGEHACTKKYNETHNIPGEHYENETHNLPATSTGY